MLRWAVKMGSRVEIPCKVTKNYFYAVINLCLEERRGHYNGKCSPALNYFFFWIFSLRSKWNSRACIPKRVVKKNYPRKKIKELFRTLESTRDPRLSLLSRWQWFRTFFNIVKIQSDQNEFFRKSSVLSFGDFRKKKKNSRLSERVLNPPRAA